MVRYGVYYTPQYISDFILDKAARFLSSKPIRLLEPCVGEGVFIESLKLNPCLLKRSTVHAVEISAESCSVVRDRFSKKMVSDIFNEDFLFFEAKEKYDLIVGNPPYVNRKYMSEAQRDCVDFLSREVANSGATIMNLWSAFVYKSSALLKQNGVLALLLPSDIAHVSHASPLKKFLKENYSRIELYEFDGTVFPDAEQKAIFLLATNESKGLPSGVFISRPYVSKGKVWDRSLKPLKVVDGDKWTNYGLSTSEINLLKRVLSGFSEIKSYCSSSPGVVTAANKYFILSERQVEENSLFEYAVPVVERAAHVKNVFSFSDDDWMFNKLSGHGCFLVDFSSAPIDAHALEYIKNGVDQGVSQRYKCRQRIPWYSIPGVKVGDALFFRRVHRYPKFVVNEAGVVSTDGAYVVNANDGVDVVSLVISFYNSVTMIFIEILGRGYGGGVLELTPSEFRKLPICYYDFPKTKARKIMKAVGGGGDVALALEEIDNFILGEKLGLKKDQILRIRKIHQKIMRGRLLSGV